MVLLARIHAALKPLGRPAERLQYPCRLTRALGHVWLVAAGEEARVVQPAGAQQQLAIELSFAGKPLCDRELA